MGMPRIHLAYEVGIVPAGLLEHLVQAVLVFGIRGVEGLVTPVHVHLAAVRLHGLPEVIDIALVRSVDEGLFFFRIQPAPPNTSGYLATA